MKIFKKIFKITLFSIIGLTVWLFIASSIYNKIGNCKIEGEIEGLGTRLALVSGGDYSYDQNFIKVIMVVNDRFSFNAKLNKPGGGKIATWNMLFDRASGKPLWMRSKMISFIINPKQTIFIKGSMNKYSINYLVTGNKVSEQKSKFVQKNLDILEKETQLYLSIDSLKFYGAAKSRIDSSNMAFNKIREEYNKKRLDYIIQNPTNEISAKFLGYQEKDTIIKYLPTLAENVLNTYSGLKLKKRVLVYSQTKAGDLAPNIVDAGLFNLADLKGKYVVLDFWGTWCGPCVRGFPKMRKYYAKYKSKVEFVGIACGDKRSVWEKFIKEEGLEWTQLLNDAQNNDFVNKYNVSSFPTKVIIDKEGKIVEIFEGENINFYEKLDFLMKK